MESHLVVSVSPDFKRMTLISGGILLVTGIIGMVLPQVISVVLSLLIAWLFIASGFVTAYFNWYAYRVRWGAWLKSFLLTLLGFLMAFHPAAGAATLGLLLAIYFLFDAFAGIGFGLELRPLQGWGWMFFNGVLSLLLALVILIGWPFSAVSMVGLLVGISLFFDGFALLMLGLKAKVV